MLERQESGKSVEVTRFRDRSTTCASCRGASSWMVLLDQKRFASACNRHLELWKRRAQSSATSTDGETR